MSNSSYQVSYGQTAEKGRHTFSTRELKELGISLAVLSVVFALFFENGIGGIVWVNFPYTLIVSFVAVVTAFLFHELAHKFVAQKYGFWAEFRYWQFGLLIALFFSMSGFIFASPGAVMIYGNVTKEQNGKISLAGPLSNFCVAGIFLGLWAMFPDFEVGEISVFGSITFINAFIGGFNLLPIMPFDGAKIVKWNKPVYISMVAIALVFVYIFFAP